MARRRGKAAGPEALIGLVVFAVFFAPHVSVATRLAVVAVAIVLAVVFLFFKFWREGSDAPTEPRRTTWQPSDLRAGRIKADGPSSDARFRKAPTAGPLPATVDTKKWSIALIRSLEWRRFEILCEELWRALGYEVRSTGPGADGGIDVELFRPSALGKLLAVVQCKSRIRDKVGVAVARELYGVMHHAGAPMGILMTSSGFHPDALEFAKGKPIQMIDVHRLFERIEVLPAEKRNALLQNLRRFRHADLRELRYQNGSACGPVR